MTNYKISCLTAAAVLGGSSVHQVRAAGVYSAPALFPKSAMERPGVNAGGARAGDYVVRALRRKMSAEPENVAVRLELIEHYGRAGYPELALEHCRLAATRFPESAEVRLSLTKTLRTLKMTREAADGLAGFLAAH